MATTYTKMDMLNDINMAVERYIEQELAAMIPPDNDDDIEIIVCSDSEGDDIDTTSGDIWNLETQEIIGQKDLKTGKKIWFGEEEEEAPGDEEEEEEEEVVPPPSPPSKKEVAPPSKKKSRKKK